VEATVLVAVKTAIFYSTIPGAGRCRTLCPVRRHAKVVSHHSEARKGSADSDYVYAIL
jgi:hypothetical protein